MTRKFSLDIFDLLGRLNSAKSGDIYANLSDDERKGFAPLVVERWMTGTSDERQIVMINELVNPYVFSLGKHPHLLMQLLQVASSKKDGRRYYWLGVKGGKKKGDAVKVVAEYLDMSLREARALKPFPTGDEVLRMAEELGWQKDDLKKLEKELKE